MILVAVTGSICSGKSFVSNIIADLGYAVFSCDDEIHKILAQENILSRIKQNFPEAIIGDLLNKNLLAEIIFEDLKAKEKLEAILYPKLFAQQDKFIEKHKKNKILFFEVPLLYEKNLQDKYDFVITTYAPQAVLIKRAQDRKITQKIFFNILNSQISCEEKKKRANYIINTDDMKHQIKEKICNIIEEILTAARKGH